MVYLYFVDNKLHWFIKNIFEIRLNYIHIKWKTMKKSFECNIDMIVKSVFDK